MNYNSASALRAFLEENGLGMRKKFGQNFLVNPGARRALIEALGAETGDAVWEIGPGLGAMTRGLLEKGLLVRAFEIDLGFARALKGIFGDDPGFALVEGDALKTWPSQPPAPFLLGNLPYNVGATLLADFVEKGLFFKRMVVTVQREVARRMAAGVGDAEYSSFSVLCASAYRVKPLMLIKGASFYPRPNVDSQGVLFELRKDASGEPFAKTLPGCFYPLTRGLFSSRRKTIRNNLTAFLSRAGKRSPLDVAAPTGEIAEGLLAKSAIDGGLRAENLRVEDFAALAKGVEDMGVLS